MSNLDELIESIKFSVRLPDDSNEEDLALNPDWVMAIASSAIEKQKEKLDKIRFMCEDPKNRSKKTLLQQCKLLDEIRRIILS